jgi:hypothetical protein
MFGCAKCKTDLTAKVGGKTVCYYCGSSALAEYQPVEIDLGSSVGEAIGESVIDDDWETYHLDD